MKKRASYGNAKNFPPGVTLRHTLRGHQGKLARVAWSPDGSRLASVGTRGPIRIWDPKSGRVVRSLIGHSGEILAVTWSPGGERIASGGDDGTLRIWNVESGKLLETVNAEGTVTSCAWSPDGQVLAYDNRSNLCLRNVPAKATLWKRVHRGRIWSLAWSADSRTIASASEQLRLWSLDGALVPWWPTGHQDRVNSLTWSANRTILVSASNDRTIRLWEPGQERLERILEGHTGDVCWAAFSHDDAILASKSQDGSIRFWRADTWEIVGELAEPTDDECLYFANPAFHPGAPVLATFGEYDTVVRIWDIDVEALLGAGRSEPATTVQYTTAKIVLVGDSGVGKTGLGWRLANGTYREHDSTHGQQFWVVNELGTRRGDGTQCEAVLWDLAGQPDYRVVHSLFLSDVDLALVLFDPANRQEPLSGPSFWLKQLRRDDGLCPALLVGARQDRGTPTLTAADLQAFCEQHEISGGFVGTSARTGEGIPGLVAAIQGQIRWDEMTATVATTSFKRIKDYVLSLKEDPAATGLLLAPAALRRALRATDPAWEFDEAEMMTAVRHLATHGYVTILRGSRGDTFILLAPDLLVNLASSFVLEARRNARGLGVLEEERLLRGDYPFPELARLAAAERAILLDATTVLFLERNLCFRESFNDQVFLVFPSLINERRPSAEEVAVVDDVSYRVKGAVENVYAMLVVLLGYTNTFTRTNQWQNQAQYQMGEGEVCGFRQTASPEGEIELVLLYGQQTPEYVRTLFQGLFERFLRRRDLTISRYHPVTCHACGERLARNVVLEQLRRDRAFSFCSHCGERLVLPAMEDLTRRPLHEEEAPFDHEQAIAVRRTAFEAALVRVKALLRDRGAAEERPTCFISYAWGEVGHERWVMKLAADLRNAGFDVLLDRWHNPPGSSVSRYIERIESSRYVVVAATPALREKYMTRASDPVVAAELSLINTRVRQPNRFGHTVIPLLRAGTPQTALTPMLEDVVSIDFTGEDLYFVNLFNLIWRMFELPFDNPLLLELQAAMSPSRP